MANNYWLKLRRDFFKRHDIKIIESMPNGKHYVLFYLKLLLESVDHDGALRFSESVAYTDEMLAAITETDITTVSEAMEALTALKIVEIDDDGTIVLPYAVKSLGFEADNDNAKRQARYRAKRRAENSTVTGVTQSNGQSNAIVTDRVTESNGQSNAKVTKSNVTGVTKSNESIELELETELETDIKESKEKKRVTAPHSDFIPPDPDDILKCMTDYAHKKGLSVDVVVEAEKFFNYYSEVNWKVGNKGKMKDYESACRNWLLRAQEYATGKPTPSTNPFGDLFT